METVKNAKITWKTYLNLFLIYVVIFLQYPFALAAGMIVFNVNIAAQMRPEYLVWWCLVRLFIVLPLLFGLLSQLEADNHTIYLQMGQKNKMLNLTFWGTIIFSVLGIFLYPQFLHRTSLTFFNLSYLLPIFILFAISNAFVEETFFRGGAMAVLSNKMPFWVANLIQGVLFAAIHLFNPMSRNLMLFVGLTFLLGIFWGWLTRSTKSLIPAIVLHIVADFFVAFSLF